MLLIKCPWCGERPETEFVCTGEAKAPRPEDPHALSDEAWVDYLCVKDNRRGIIEEAWWHAKGCGLWFNLLRHTVTHETQPAPGEGGR